MVSPQDLLKNFKTTPFDLWGIRTERQQFEIIEDLPASKNVRTSKVTREFNGQKVSKDVFLIRVRVGLFDKDLAITERELTKMALLIPEAEQKNWKGAVFAFNETDLTYICTNHGDNTPDSTQSAPITQNQSPVDQKDAFVNKLIESMKAVNMIGTDLYASDVMKIADKISPGNAVQILGIAKSKGLVSEVDGGVWKVN